MTGRDINREPVNATLIRGYGTLAGLGLIGAAICAIPSTLFLDPLPPAEYYLSTVSALVAGLVCMALPWERMDARWLHIVGVIATVEAAIAVALFGPTYTVVFFLIAVAVAYVTATWKVLMAHVALIGVALFGPVLWGPADPRETAQVALVTFPLLCLTTGIFAYLRQRMVANQSSYRIFAEETLSLATRIAGRPLGAGHPISAGNDLPPWPARLRVSARAAGAAAAVLALPLVTAGLAVAGVKLPAFASDSLGSVGVDLPNQEIESAGRTTPGPSWDRGEMPAPDRRSREISANGGIRSGAADEGEQDGNGEGGTSLESDPSSLSGGSANGGSSSNSAPPLNPSQVGSGNTGSSAVPEDVLDDTTETLDEILGGNREGADAEEPRRPSAEGGSDGFAGPGYKIDEG